MIKKIKKCINDIAEDTLFFGGFLLVWIAFFNINFNLGLIVLGINLIVFALLLFAKKQGEKKEQQ